MVDGSIALSASRDGRDRIALSTEISLTEIT